MNKTELLLIQLAEECGEVIQAVSKALRFGLDNHFVGTNTTVTNEDRIRQELIDINAIWDMIPSLHVTCGTTYSERLKEKQKKVEKYLEYSKECGILK